MNNTQVLYALNQTLLQHEGIRRGSKRSNHTTDEMIRHYNCGNLNEALFSEDSAQVINENLDLLVLNAVLFIPCIDSGS